MRVITLSVPVKFKVKTNNTPEEIVAAIQGSESDIDVALDIFVGADLDRLDVSGEAMDRSSLTVVSYELIDAIYVGQSMYERNDEDRDDANTKTGANFEAAYRKLVGSMRRIYRRPDGAYVEFTSHGINVVTDEVSLEPREYVKKKTPRTGSKVSR